MIYRSRGVRWRVIRRVDYITKHGQRLRFAVVENLDPVDDVAAGIRWRASYDVGRS